MTAFLHFRLQAPLVSWGDITVGEVRSSWDRPGRSVILGLVGAALGVRRVDHAAQDALRADFRTAIRAEAIGTQLTDYHTYQTVSKSLVKRLSPATREQLLSIRDKETLLSRREYRESAMMGVVLWATATPKWPLVEIASALKQPVFALYAGRRSNVLGLPMVPTIIEASTLAEAFHSAPSALDGSISDLRWLEPRGGWGSEVSHDECHNFHTGLVEPFRRVTRRDIPTSRTSWLFDERTVFIGNLPSVEA